jgi:hypothetical protein
VLLPRLVVLVVLVVLVSQLHLLAPTVHTAGRPHAHDRRGGKGQGQCQLTASC